VLGHRLIIAAVGLCLAGGCRNPHESEIGGEQVIVSTEASALSVLRVHDGSVVARPGPVPRGAYGFARSADDSLVYYAGADEYSQRQVLALNTRSLQIAWRELLADLEHRSRVEGLELLSPHALAPTPSGTRMLLAPARRAGDFGVAVLDGATRDPVDFLGPLNASPEGITTVPPSGTHVNGAVVIAGTRTSGAGPKEGWLFLLDGVSLAPRDSVRLTSGVDDEWAGLGQVIAAPFGEAVYIRGPDGLLRYDLLTRDVTASPPTDVRGRLSVAADGGSIYLADEGDGRFSAGTGFLYRYSADLATVEPIDLRAEAVNGSGPTIQSAATSGDSRTIYVLVGNPSIGPVFPGQSLRVLVVDAISKAVGHSFPVGGYGGGPIFVR
jgi:hypothetical protein